MGRVPLFRLSAPTVDSVALSFRDLSQPAQECLCGGTQPDHQRRPAHSTGQVRPHQRLQEAAAAT
jgi:hypothetical protein